MSRGNFRQETFLDGAHYRRYLDLLERVAVQRDWGVLDWCLIPNHFHLLIQLTCGGLSGGMQALNGGFSRWSNAQTGRTGTGHLWKNRFKAVEIVEQEHFLETARYVPNNPVAAGLVRRPEDWPWSGYRANVGLEHPRAFHDTAQLLAYFGREADVAIVRYEQFVHDGIVRSGHAAWSDQGYESRTGPG
jgi:putative transposase